MTSQNSPIFAPGEYVTRSRTTASIDADSFRLALLAIQNKDRSALNTMRNDGRVFNLPKNTRVTLLPLNGAGTPVAATIDGADLCSAEIESGSYIGSRVVIPCGSIRRAR